jgi:uncharacterized protein (TIGR02186 family)
LTLRWVAVVLCFIASAAQTENVVLGLSKDSVAITANFDGSDILVFGAVKRESPIPATPLQVIVTISGPYKPLTVRRKDKRFGIWINTESVQIEAAPSFYAVATSAPWDKVITDQQDTMHHVSVVRAIEARRTSPKTADQARFAEAVIRIKTSENLYQMLENSVSVDQQTLFRTSIAMPSNLTEGRYDTRILLTRDGEVISTFNTEIDVRKVGLERFLFSLSRERPLVYGLLSLAIAIFAGWAASGLFNILRRS